MIRAGKLSKRYGDKRVLEDLDFRVERGEFLLVTGPNGAGKTTLLHLAVGLTTPTAGVVYQPAVRNRVSWSPRVSFPAPVVRLESNHRGKGGRNEVHAVDPPW